MPVSIENMPFHAVATTVPKDIYPLCTVVVCYLGRKR